MNINILVDYDTLNAKDAIKAIQNQPPDKLEEIFLHEFANKRRKTVMSAIIIEIGKHSEKGIEEYSKIKEIYQNEVEGGFTILQVGQTGVGKSATINSFFREEVAKTSKYVPGTREVKAYQSKYHGVKYTIYDTPGLGEARGGTELDREYLSQMITQCSSPDILWYVLRLDDHRIRRTDTTAIELIQETFGSEIWDRTLTVFTHADKLTPQEFEKALRERTRTVNELITEVTNRKSSKVPAIAITNLEPYITPDGKNWLGELFTTTLEQVDPNRIHTFFLAFAADLEIPKSQSPETTLQESDETEEISEKRIKLDEEQLKRVEKKAFETTLILTGAAIGAGIDASFAGGTLGIPTAIGGIIGGIVELWKWLRDE